MQSEPKQGQAATVDTEVKIIYDEKNLYVGAYCEEPLGKSGIYIQDLRRDFSYTQNELFGVLFDPSNLFMIFNTAKNVINPETGVRVDQKSGFFKLSYIQQI